MKSKYLTLLGILGLDLIFLGAMLSWILSEFVLVSKISLIAGVVVLIAWAILSRKRAKTVFGKRTVSMGASTTLSVAFFAGILIIANIVGARYTLRGDLTKERLFSLSEQTAKVLDSLDTDVEILLFDNEDSPKNPRAKEIISEYGERSRRVSHRIIDPDRQPQITKQYGVAQYGQAVVRIGETKYMLVPDASEEGITNAIKQLTAKGGTKVYFTVGHGEPALHSTEPEGLSALKDGITKEGLLADTLNFMLTGKIPDDAAVVAMVGPRANPLPAELDALKEYFDRGGKLLVMLEPGVADSVASWTRNFGVEISDNMIVDASSMGRMFGAGPEMPLVMQYDQNHAITKEFNVATMFPTARMVRASQEPSQSLRVVEIAKTTDRAWAEKKWRAGTVQFDENEDAAGPVPIACAVENITRTPQPRMAIFGDPDFITNRYIVFSGNSDLILNTIAWLGKQEKLIAIRAKDPEDRKLMLTPRQQQQIFYLSVVGLPFLAIILAELAWWRKQR